jgi:hypothetical protein
MKKFFYKIKKSLSKTSSSTYERQDSADSLSSFKQHQYSFYNFEYNYDIHYLLNNFREQDLDILVNNFKYNPKTPKKFTPKNINWTKIAENEIYDDKFLLYFEEHIDLKETLTRILSTKILYHLKPKILEKKLVNHMLLYQINGKKVYKSLNINDRTYYNLLRKKHIEKMKKQAKKNEKKGIKRRHYKKSKEYK